MNEEAQVARESKNSGLDVAIPTQTEEAYFAALGVEWIEPHLRSVATIELLRSKAA